MIKPFAAEVKGEQGRVLDVIIEQGSIFCLFIGRTNTVKQKVPVKHVECLNAKAAAKLKKAIKDLL